MSVPKLRFKEFEGDWIKKCIGDFVISHKGGASLTPEDFVKSSSCEVIPKKGIGSGGWLATDPSDSVYCHEDFFEKNQRSVVDSTYLITTLRDLVPSGPSIGYIVKYKGEKKYILAQGVYGLKVDYNKIYDDFIINFSNTLKYRRYMQTIMVGSTQVHVRNDDFFSVEFFVPSLPEQTKIANFLTTIDDYINQLTRKHELLTQYKKAVMQQIFSQQLRFKDENGEDFADWEEKEIKEILTIGNGRDYKHLASGDVPVFGTGGLMTMVDKFLYEGETVCIGRKGTIDKPMYYKGKLWTVDTLFFTHSFNNVLPKFVFILFQRINWKEHNEASGVPSLSKSTIEKINVPLPDVAEQKKIVGFIDAIDQQLDQLQQQINQIKQYKQGLLQQMFV